MAFPPTGPIKKEGPPKRGGKTKTKENNEQGGRKKFPN